MKLSLPSACIIGAVLSFATGCVHSRYSFFSTVGGEMQKLTTRNRYTLVAIKYADRDVNADVAQGNLHSQPFSNTTLKKLQPGVFSDDGVRFLLREERLPYKVTSLLM